MMKKALYALVRSMRMTRVLDEDFLKSIIVAIPKKSNAKSWKNTEQSRQIVRAKNASYKKKSLFTSKNIILNIRKLMRFVCSTAYYRSQTWTMDVRKVRGLAAFENCCYRRLLTMISGEMMMNEQVNKGVGKK
jgi:hypothetical protein